MSRDYNEELETDLFTHNANPRHPIIHRIAFEEASVYVTRSTTVDRNVLGAILPIVGNNLQGPYRIFPWLDHRALGVLGIELGDKSPIFGRCELIGRFKPVDSDLEDVQYDSLDGKAYFKSANEALANNSTKPADQKASPDRTETNAITNADTSVPPRKVDSRELFQLNEIVPVGVQAKALQCNDHLTVFDGPAGTGKSTTAIQQIKLLISRGAQQPAGFVVLVKHQRLIPGFKNLLMRMQVTGVKVTTLKKLLEEMGLDELVSLVEDAQGIGQSSQAAEKPTELMVRFKSSADHVAKLNQLIEATLIPQKLDLLRLEPGREKNFLSLEKQFQHIPGFTRQFQAYRRKVHQVTEKIQEHKQELVVFRKLTDEKCLALQSELVREKLKKKKKRPDNPLVQGALTETENAEINTEVKRFRNAEQLDMEKIERRQQEELKQESNDLKKLASRLVELTLADTTLSSLISNPLDRFLVKSSLESRFGFSSKYHLVTLDEAQEFSSEEIAFLRLLGDRVTLTGDAAQVENNPNFNGWDDLAKSSSYFLSKNEYSIFRLVHNFRQTYELGSASANFRRLILGENLKDDVEDYFENQIGFSRPEVRSISNEAEILQPIKNMVSYSKTIFTAHVPVTIFYHTDAVRLLISKLLDGEEITYRTESSDGEKLDRDCFLVSSNEIAGREFPLVIATLPESIAPKALYVMFSRAQFQLVLVSLKESLSDYRELLALSATKFLSHTK